MAIGAQIGGGGDGAVGLDELLTNHFAAEWIDDYKCEFCNNRADLPPPLPPPPVPVVAGEAGAAAAPVVPVPMPEPEAEETAAVVSSPTCTYRQRLAGAAPPLLILHLKRFGSLDSAALDISTATGGLDSCRAKSHRKVIAPLSLDLGRFAEFDDASLTSTGGGGSPVTTRAGYTYTLYAIVVHDGGMCAPSSCCCVFR